MVESYVSKYRRTVSWDVLLQSLPPGVRSIADIPDDFRPGALCSRQELVAKIRASVPAVDFNDPLWGRIEGNGFSIELNVGEKDPVQSLMLHVRGGDEALGVVKLIAEALAVRAIDCSGGELIDFSSPAGEASLRAWRGYRDRVVG